MSRIIMALAIFIRSVLWWSAPTGSRDLQIVISFFLYCPWPSRDHKGGFFLFFCPWIANIQLNHFFFRFHEAKINLQIYTVTTNLGLNHLYISLWTTPSQAHTGFYLTWPFTPWPASDLVSTWPLQGSAHGCCWPPVSNLNNTWSLWIFLEGGYFLHILISNKLFVTCYFQSGECQGCPVRRGTDQSRRRGPVP